MSKPNSIIFIDDSLKNYNSSAKSEIRYMTYQSAVNDVNSTDKTVSIVPDLSFTNAYESISSYHRFHWPPGLPFPKKQLVYIDIYPPVTCIIMRLSTVWRDYQLIVEWSQKIFYEIRALWKIYRIIHGTLVYSRIQLILFNLKNMAISLTISNNNDPS